MRAPHAERKCPGCRAEDARDVAVRPRRRSSTKLGGPKGDASDVRSSGAPASVVQCTDPTAHERTVRVERLSCIYTVRTCMRACAHAWACVSICVCSEYRRSGEDEETHCSPQRFCRIHVSGLPHMKLWVIICIKMLMNLKTSHENSKLMIPDFDTQKNTLTLILFFNLDFSGYLENLSSSLCIFPNHSVPSVFVLVNSY